MGWLEPAKRLSPLDLDYEEYCHILAEEGTLKHGFPYRLHFLDAKDRKVQITNQITFRTAVVYQVARKAEMIFFTVSEPSIGTT